MRENVTDHNEKTLKLTEQDTCNTPYPGEPEKFKKSADDKHPNASPIAKRFLAMPEMTVSLVF